MRGEGGEVEAQREEDLISRVGRNCCFYKKWNKQAALGILAHKNPGEKASLSFSVSLLGLKIDSTKNPNEKQTLN